jgi:hypothetical protein
MRTFLRSSEARWTIVVAVLAIAGVVALWPRSGAETEPGGRTLPWSVGTDASVMTMPSDDELAPLRARAGLAPCPALAHGAPPAAGPLAGITVPCLGTPGEVDLAAAMAGPRCSTSGRPGASPAAMRSRSSTPTPPGRTRCP